MLLAGEAGIGKTSLVRAFVAAHGDRGSSPAPCDALYTPRPLGPLLDIAEEPGGELAARRRRGATPRAIVARARCASCAARRRPSSCSRTCTGPTRRRSTSLRLLAPPASRRVPALVVATYRDDELDRDHPLRHRARRAAAAGAVHRIGARRRCRATRSRALARPHGVDAGELHRAHRAATRSSSPRSLAAGRRRSRRPSATPCSPARRGCAAGARALLDAVAIVPPRAELWLLEALAGRRPRRARRVPRLGHAPRRRATRSRSATSSPASRSRSRSPPHRRIALHRAALAALERPRGRADLARLAHHAEAAGDARRGARATRRPRASAPAALGAHREAAAQFARALRYAGGARAGRAGATLLERRSYECYLTDHIDEAIAARRRRARGAPRGRRPARARATRTAGSRGWPGSRATARRPRPRRRLAVDLLEPLPPGRELAMAYSNMSQLRMLAERRAGATALGRAGDRAGRAPRRDRDPRPRAQQRRHARSCCAAGRRARRSSSAASPSPSTRASRSTWRARYTNLARDRPSTARDYARADALPRRRDRVLRASATSTPGASTCSATGRGRARPGRWDAAAATATRARRPAVTAPARITPLAVLGLHPRPPRRAGPVGAARRGARPRARAPASSSASRRSPSRGPRRSGSRASPTRIEAETAERSPSRSSTSTTPGSSASCASGAGGAGHRRRRLRRRGRRAVPARARRRYTRAAQALGERSAARTRRRSPLAHADAERTQRRALDELQRLGARPAAASSPATLRERGAARPAPGPPRRDAPATRRA